MHVYNKLGFVISGAGCCSITGDSSIIGFSISGVGVNSSIGVSTSFFMVLNW